MKRIIHQAPFWVTAVLLCSSVALLFPLFQYYIDPDGTAYLTISRRYADGNFLDAVNGYWSPWSCWLTAILMKTGIAAIPASVVVNTLGAVGFLGVGWLFFRRAGFTLRQQWLFGGAISIFLVYAIFAQSFDDIWECFFLLLALYLFLGNQFSSKPFWWVVVGVIGALSYFSKAYAFPFFVANTLVCCYFLEPRQPIKVLKMSLTIIGAMLVCAAPWLLVLHHKYGYWTTSTAGTLNMSWYLVGHPLYKDFPGQFLPPPFPDSPYYWEDPMLVNGPAPHFWTSWALAGRQFLRLGQNFLKLLIALSQLSIFYPFVLGFVGLISLPKRKFDFLLQKEQYMLVSMAIFTLGYALINYESRYLWYLIIPGIVLTFRVIKLQKQLSFLHVRLLTLSFAISLTIVPIHFLFTVKGVGMADYEVAQELKKIASTPFTAICTPGVETQRMARIAYFSTLPYCHHVGTHEVVADMKTKSMHFLLSLHPLTSDKGLVWRATMNGVYIYEIR